MCCLHSAGTFPTLLLRLSLFNMCFHPNAISGFVYGRLFFTVFSLFSICLYRFLCVQLLFLTARAYHSYTHGSKRFSILFFFFFFFFFFFVFFLCDRSGRSFAMLIIPLFFLSSLSCMLFGCCPITNPVSAIFFTVSYFPPAIRSGGGEKKRERNEMSGRVVVTTRTFLTTHVMFFCRALNKYRLHLLIG